MKRLLCPLLAVTLALAPATIQCVVIRVPDDEGSIEAGLGAASPGDTVLVACDVYYEHSLDVPSGVCLTSETGLPGCVTIDAQSNGVVLICDASSPQTVVCGLTLTGGHSDGQGGGLLCVDGYSGCEPQVIDCVLIDNEATVDGGAVYCPAMSAPTFARCQFLDNRAGVLGGAVRSHSYASPVLMECVLSGNSARLGGGASCWTSDPEFSDCVIADNSATEDGGGLHCYHTQVTLNGCTIVGNSAGGGGGGLFCNGSSAPTLTNCIIAYSQLGAGVHCFDASTPSLSCCDVYGNAGGDWTGCIEGQAGVSDNFCADPLFCDVFDGDFYLCANSPCLAGVAPCGILVGALGQGCGPCGSTSVPWEDRDATWGVIKSMFR
jgi:hypothetical protein